MAPYDSDSSDDGEDYATTNVTLGYATTESTGDDASQLGGHPTWLDPSMTPPATLAKCKVCNSHMSLLLQLNADLLQYFPNDERRLRILCCRRKQCSKKIGSIRSFRETRKPATREGKEKKQGKKQEGVIQATKPAQDLGSALFGGPTQSTTTTMNGSNPFSMSSSTSQSTVANPFASISSPSTLAALSPQRPADEPQPPTQSFAHKLKIGTDSSSDIKPEPTPQAPWPSASEFPPPYPSFYLDAYPEELEHEKATDLPLNGGESSKTQYDVEDATGSGAKGGDKDTFESSLDKTFQKFSDRIAQNPEQVLRYEFKGEPLLYSGNDDVAIRFIVPHGKAGAPRGMPRCESCGSQRVFEIQLVPGLIYELEKDEELNLEDGMEWGTIIVGTCANNCGDAGKVSFKEEWVGVQWEERVERK